jgi:hypothetical protein
MVGSEVDWREKADEAMVSSPCCAFASWPRGRHVQAGPSVVKLLRHDDGTLVTAEQIDALRAWDVLDLATVDAHAHPRAELSIISSRPWFSRSSSSCADDGRWVGLPFRG